MHRRKKTAINSLRPLCELLHPVGWSRGRRPADKVKDHIR